MGYVWVSRGTGTRGTGWVEGFGRRSIALIRPGSGGPQKKLVLRWRFVRVLMLAMMIAAAAAAAVAAFQLGRGDAIELSAWR